VEKNEELVPAAGSEAPAELVHRLRRIEGQIRGLQRMVEDGRQCGDILTQVLAVRSSLDQVALQVFNEQIDHCLDPHAIDADTRRILQESVRLWAKFT
jgi:CsoR family transcriptional regulator, copper-sensing transcriptional repressor